MNRTLPPPDTEPAPEVICLSHLWAGYGQEPVLEDINLSVRELDFIGLIGPNGSGKTTLFRVMLGLLPPLRGSVTILGQPMQQGRRYVGYVPQHVEFDEDFPIRVEDVVLSGRLGRRGWRRSYGEEDHRVVTTALEAVELVNHRHRRLGELSGGQRKRAYIARALATDPKILLLDEPLAGVDSHIGTHLYELLQQLNQHLTILMISHDIGAISSCVKTVGCLNRRLYYHNEKQITPEMLEIVYQCPVDLIAHGVPHRVFPQHLLAEITSPDQQPWGRQP
ncbi:MAG: metal ABC transporter ATP-binding protein [Nodosilinea sp.]